MNDISYKIQNPAVVVLAAGAGSRMGSVKPLLPYQGITLIENALKAAGGCGASMVAVVVGAHGERVRNKVEGLGVIVIDNPDWAEGMASSIRVAIQAIQQKDPGIDGIIMMVCDQPFVTFSVLKDLIEKQQETGLPVAASSYGGKVGTPALFHRKFFPALSTLSGDSGARGIIQKNGAEVTTVDFPEGSIDIDTKKDYEQLLKQNRPDDY